MKTQRLILQQIDRKIIQLKKVEDLSIPPSGWIYAIRMALSMSLRQVGNRMGIKPQSVREIEQREKNGTVSLNVLRQFGKCLNLKLVYGFVPVDQSLNDLIEKRALQIAEEIVKRTSISMELEDQDNNPKRIQKAIIEKANEIKLEMPKYLWD